MNYVLKDHIGSLYATVTDGEVEYYSFDAWGRERNHNTLQYDNINTTFDRGFCMHEHYRDFNLINMNGRLYDPLVGRMLSPDIVIQDPEYSQSYNRYSYCFNNPLRFTDPSGYVVRGRNDVLNPYFLYYDFSSFSSDGSSFNTDMSAGKQLPVDDWYEDSDGNIQWTDYKSQAEMDMAGIDGKYLGEAVVYFQGSRNEKLGQGDNLFGEGALLAKVVVYGPTNENDIKNYEGFTMSSNYEKYGAVDNGDYYVFWDEMGKTGALSSHWAVNKKNPVDCLDGVNPNPDGYSRTQKTGIFIHSSNRNGSMNPIGKDGKVYPVSTGCLIIAPSRNGRNGWHEFNQQLDGLNSFMLQIRRD